MVVKFWHSFQIVDNSKVLKLWGVLWDFIQFQKEKEDFFSESVHIPHKLLLKKCFVCLSPYSCSSQQIFRPCTYELQCIG